MRLVPLAVLLLAGCAPMQWAKPGATAVQAEDAFTECRQEAWREARLRSSWLHRPFVPFVVRDGQGREFLAWPYGGFHDPFGEQFMEESRLTNFCMRAKGYELEPVEKDATRR